MESVRKNCLKSHRPVGYDDGDLLRSAVAGFYMNVQIQNKKKRKKKCRGPGKIKREYY